MSIDTQNFTQTSQSPQNTQQGPNPDYHLNESAQTSGLGIIAARQFTY